MTATYDLLNQLIQTTTPESETVANTYNGEGLRVAKTVDGTTINYLYEYDKVVLETDSSGAQKARNVYGTNLISRNVDGQTAFYLYNGHSDVTALIDGQGNNLATYYYDAFGNITEHTGSFDNNITYAGYQYDKETGKYYLNARMYDPVTARFMQEDTYRGDVNDPLSLNLYTYCHNEPLMYTDPSGHKEGDWWDYKTYVAGGKKVIQDVKQGASEVKDAASFVYHHPVEATNLVNQTVIKPAAEKLLGKDTWQYNLAKETLKRPIIDFETGQIERLNLVRGVIQTPETIYKIGVKPQIDLQKRAILETMNSTGMMPDNFYNKEVSQSNSDLKNDWQNVSGMGLGIVNNAVTAFNPYNQYNYLTNNDISLQDSVKQVDAMTQTALLVLPFAVKGLGLARGESSTVGASEASSMERYSVGKSIEPMQKTLDMSLNPELYANEVAAKFGINLKGSGQGITIKFNPDLVQAGKSRQLTPNIIEIGPSAYADEATLANTIAHELNHARSWLKGGLAPEKAAYSAGNALEEFIKGLR